MSDLDLAVGALCGEADWHSAGTISVDLLTAARRQAQQYQQMPELPALWAAGEAVRLGGQRLDLTVGAQMLQIQMETTAPLWLDLEPDEFMRSRPPLVAAFETLLVQGYRQVWLELWNRDRCCEWSVRDGKPESRWETRSVPANGFSLMACDLDQPFWKRFLPSARRSALHSAIYQNLLFCPIEVRLDGRSLSEPMPERCKALGVYSAADEQVEPSSYRWLAEGIWAGRGLALAVPVRRPSVQCRFCDETWQAIESMPVLAHRQLTDFEGKPNCLEEVVPQFVRGRDLLGELSPEDLILTRRFLEQRCEQVWYLPQARPYLLNDQTLHARRWLGLPCRPQANGRLVYVRDGVALEPLTVDLPAGCSALIADTDVDLDLSRRKPVHNAKVDADLAWLSQQFDNLWRACEGPVIHGFQPARFLLPQSVVSPWRKWSERR